LDAFDSCLIAIGRSWLRVSSDGDLPTIHTRFLVANNIVNTKDEFSHARSLTFAFHDLPTFDDHL
jgi:hypothetical protein